MATGQISTLAFRIEPALKQALHTATERGPSPTWWKS